MIWKYANRLLFGYQTKMMRDTDFERLTIQPDQEPAPDETGSPGHDPQENQDQVNPVAIGFNPIIEFIALCLIKIKRNKAV